MGNTYSISPFSILCLGTKSLAASSCRFNQSFPWLLHALLVGLDHLLDHLAADGAGFAGGQVAVVALLQVDAHLLWCLFYTVNFQISIASSEVSARTGKVGTGAWSERLPMNL